MTPIEFLIRLRQLPASTPLSLPHVAAALEMLSSVLARRPNYDVGQRERWTGEAALAQWLGEPVATVEGWRLDATSKRRYRLGAVIDWLNGHRVALPDSDTDTDEDAARIDEVCWTSVIPALEVDAHLIGFFRSLNLETEPTAYALLQADTLSFEVAGMSKDALLAVRLSLIDHGKFVSTIGKSPEEAREIYLRWKKKAMPAVLLQFLRSALRYDRKLAQEIAKDIAQHDPNLLRKFVNINGWLWEQLVDCDFYELGHSTVSDAFGLAMSHGANINANTHIRTTEGKTAFHGTAAHLLSDTLGETFGLSPIGEDRENTYSSQIIALLKLGLNPDQRNEAGLSGRDIAKKMEIEYGEGKSLFKCVLEKYESNSRLQVDLDGKPHKRIRQPV